MAVIENWPATGRKIRERMAGGGHTQRRRHSITTKSETVPNQSNSRYVFHFETSLVDQKVCDDFSVAMRHVPFSAEQGKR